MKWFSIACSIYWIVLAIAAWCGYIPSNLSVGCGFACAAMGAFYVAMDSNI